VDPFGLACKNFYSVLSPEDHARILAGGEPWPSEPHRAALGEGVYAWGTREEAEDYLNRLSGRVPDLKIVEFSVDEATLASFKQVDVDSLHDPDAWMQQHSKLWGGTPDPSIEYARRQTAIGQEHYFNKSVFNKLSYS
jgi:hypothetical protein